MIALGFLLLALAILAGVVISMEATDPVTFTVLGLDVNTDGVGAFWIGAATMLIAVLGLALVVGGIRRAFRISKENRELRKAHQELERQRASQEATAARAANGPAAGAASAQGAAAFADVDRAAAPDGGTWAETSWNDESPDDGWEDESSTTESLTDPAFDPAGERAYDPDVDAPPDIKDPTTEGFDGSTPKSPTSDSSANGNATGEANESVVTEADDPMAGVSMAGVSTADDSGPNPTGPAADEDEDDRTVGGNDDVPSSRDPARGASSSST